MAARRQALRLAAHALEQRLNADTSDHAGPELVCPCGRQAQYCGRHEKTFASVLGPLRLERAYYHCDHCHSGFCPRDQALRLEPFSLTPGVLRMTASTAALLSFAESSGLLQELAGIEISVKQVERASEALGAAIGVDEREQVDNRIGAMAPTLYLGMDGTGVPMRAAEVAGRAGKQSDGSAKTREAKLVTVWTAEGRDEEGKPVRDPGSVSYSAAIESAATLDTSPALSEFASRVEREANRRGFSQANRQVVLGDGAAWIWNTAQELFPQALQILDRFHAKEHLSLVGKAVYGDSAEGKAWMHARYEDLDQGRLSAVVKSLRVHIKQPEAGECIRYLWNNRKRMRYAKFQGQGYCTSTGIVESGCKLVVGTRLKRSGMHWTVKGANAIIALRCSKLSGRFEDFWERRSERQAVAA